MKDAKSLMLERSCKEIVNEITKWLKDRKGRTLEFDDIFHYSKIIVSLTETHRLMQEIDSIEIE